MPTAIAPRQCGMNTTAAGLFSSVGAGERRACVLPAGAAKRPFAAGTHGMFDTAAARRMMVDGQVRTADVTSPDLIAAMLAVPRELFVPPALADQAYYDGDIPLGGGRVLIKPMVLAKLIQAAQVEPGDHVLDVGCGT